MPRPIFSTLTPTALDRNGITAAVSPSGAATLDIDGVLATLAYDRNGVLTAAQYTAGTLDLVTNAGAAGRAFSVATRITIYGGSDESGKNFTIWGLDKSGKNLIREVIAGPNNAVVYTTNTFRSVEKIVLDTTTTGSDVEIGVAGAVVFSTPQHVAVYAPGDENTETVTISGTDRNGDAVTDTITGVNANTVAGDVNFATVDKVEIDGAATSLEVGVDGTCNSNWFVIDYKNPDFNVGFGCAISSGGAMTYGVQHTFDDVLSSDVTETGAVTFNHETVSGKTVSADGDYTNPPNAVRLAVTAHTSGSVKMSLYQVGGS